MWQLDFRIYNNYNYYIFIIIMYALLHGLNVTKLHCYNVTIKREQNDARISYAERESLRQSQCDMTEMPILISNGEK